MSETRFGVLGNPYELGAAAVLPETGSVWRYKDSTRDVLVTVKDSGLGDEQAGDEAWVRIRIAGQLRHSIVDLVFFRRHCVPVVAS